MANSASWSKIVKDYNVLNHDFSKKPFEITAEQIKLSCQDFRETGQKEVRILCKQDTRDSRPDVFKRNNLFILPVKNGVYNIVQGEGYLDIPNITPPVKQYASKLEFELESASVGNSEMQHLDYSYATSLLRTFTGDPSLVLTIRGRKYTPSFNFNVNGQKIQVSSVQTEVDAGYEGREKIVLVEAKSSGSDNVIIRQLFYPYRQWKIATGKDITTLFFEKDTKTNIFSLWEFQFEDENDYNSVKLVRSDRYIINN